MTQLIRIVTHYFVCGIVVTDNVCTDGAPIMKWAVGKSWDRIRAWVESKNGSWTIV